MDQHFSTLELVRYDDTTRAPERDYDATAFEIDASVLAPEVVPDTMPQLYYNTSLPEACDSSKESTRQPGTPSHHAAKAAITWRWMVLVLVAAAAIAIGVGVGISHHRGHLSGKPSTKTSSSPPASQNHTITSAAQQILNDTSLAAIILDNGDRQLFFQDNNGLIRRAMRTANNQWNTSLHFKVGTSMSSDISSGLPSEDNLGNPKQNTPLAVTVSYLSGVNQITVYYVSANHTLASAIWDGQGNWSSIDSGQYLGDYTTAVDTRSLSVTLIPGGISLYVSPNTTNLNFNLALLYYENPNGNVSTLLLSANHNRIAFWLDVTSQQNIKFQEMFSDRLDTNSMLGIPFTSGLYNTDPSHSSISLSFYSNRDDSIATRAFKVSTTSNGNFTADLTRLYGGDEPLGSGVNNQRQIRQSDLAMYGGDYLWINGTRPVGSNTLPDNIFPFARLASTNSADQSTTFLYHQINGSTFAEEQWDNSEEAWIGTDYITVSDS